MKKTHYTQSLNDNYVELINNFYRILRIKRNFLNIGNTDLSKIGNTDETPLYLDIWNKKGYKNIIITTFGKEKIRIIVLPVILVDGSKLPLFFVVKRNKGKRKEKNLYKIMNM